MSNKRKPVTAAELMQRLTSDPGWLRQNQIREDRRRARIAQLRAELEPEERPMLEELAKAGHAVSSVWDLVNTNAAYPAAIPVLARYLPSIRHPSLRQGVARALTVPEARGCAGMTILQELVGQKDAPGSEERWALANALVSAADRSMVDEISAMAADPSYADVRERFEAALERLCSE
ncbi:MAG TPA: hypothetical protein VHX65_05425 [Pirellulales bacterium]|nr:hypothetical protein [Pirellulales bacterium]